MNSNRLRLALSVLFVTLAHCQGTISADNEWSNGAGPNSTGGSSGSSGTSGNANTPPGLPIPGDVVDPAGTVVPEAYQKLALVLSAAEGIEYRYGPDSTAYHATPETMPTWWHPTDNFFANDGNGLGWHWQVGGPISAQSDQGLDDFSGNQGQVLFVADDTSKVGVSDVNTLTMSRNTVAEGPELPWQYYGNGAVDVNVVDYLKTQTIGQPVAIGRCYGSSGWCANSWIGYQNGVLATSGSNTARSQNILKLDANKVPTAIAVTNNAEFALVTVWDTAQVKGQVAVVALGPASQGFVHDTFEWPAVYPCFRNLGDFGFAKILGYIDLPGMQAPTEISASTDYSPTIDDQQGWLCAPTGPDCRVQAKNFPLATEANRLSFAAGGSNANHYSKTGFAVVISKSEKKAVFLDLKPLFAKVQSMYFGTPADFAKTQTLGQDPTQWPYAFSAAPEFAPTVITTLPFAEKPTAVRTSLSKGNRALVATQEGTLHIIDVGGYGDGMAATAASIAEVGTIAVGKNPTSIAYAKHDPAGSAGFDIANNELIVASRGDRKIDWVKLSADRKSGAIVRTLTDSRLVDPISVEDNDVHGTESYIVSITDYAGKQVADYRFGNVVFWTNQGAPGNTVAAACQPASPCKMGPTGADPFEFAGAFATAGKPYQFSEANVP